MSKSKHYQSRAATLLCGLTFITASNTHAQSATGNNAGCTPNPRDAAAAAQLFHEGYVLRQEGKDDAACKKFEESARLDPMAGTLMNLAECRANQGKIATASGWYHKAVTLAENQGDKALFEKAREHARELDTELSYLKIQVENPLPGLEIRRDDVVIGPAQLNEPLPIDPGEHVIAASAPGHKSVMLTVRVGEVGDYKTVIVPGMEALPPPAPAAPSSPPVQPTPLHAVNTNPWPWVVGGVGAAAIVVGSVSGILALHDKSRVEDGCKSGKGCQDPQAYALQSQRDAEWTLARISLPIGVAAVGAAVTWLALEKGSREQPRSAVKGVGASADQRGALLWVSGRF
jgi:hypothetical protein